MADLERVLQQIAEMQGTIEMYKVGGEGREWGGRDWEGGDRWREGRRVGRGKGAGALTLEARAGGGRTYPPLYYNVIPLAFACMPLPPSHTPHLFLPVQEYQKLFELDPPSPHTHICMHRSTRSCLSSTPRTLGRCCSARRRPMPSTR